MVLSLALLAQKLGEVVAVNSVYFAVVMTLRMRPALIPSRTLSRRLAMDGKEEKKKRASPVFYISLRDDTPRMASLHRAFHTQCPVACVRGRRRLVSRSGLRETRGRLGARVKGIEEGRNGGAWAFESLRIPAVAAVDGRMRPCLDPQPAERVDRFLGACLLFSYPWTNDGLCSSLERFIRPRRQLLAVCLI